ncbi:MAG: integrase arm-type DNA-binding domain-containing protein [Dinoroseobacter sp.]|nr:integrase arm-type DNA-binding domain-containing protein [Dinoroseobacter sp.]
MPKKARELTALDVKRLEHPDPASGQKHRFPVGGVNGLYLACNPTGAKSWLWRYSIGGRRKAMGLGPYPDVPLKTARERARLMADQVWQGIDPQADRAAQRPHMTFADAVSAFADDKLAEVKNPKHRKQYLASLNADVIPVIGKMSVADIAPQDVLRVLKPIWSTKTESARKLRGRIEAVLAYATVAGFRTGDNPARWKNNLDHMLPKPSKVRTKEKWPAIQLHEAASWMADVRSREGFATRALEFTALTAARSGEVRGMTWDEVDMDNGIWTVPAERMKASSEHRVPLSPDALGLLSNLARLGDSDFVFPAPRGGMLSDMALSATMRRIHEAKVKNDMTGYVDGSSRRPAVVHGCRSTFRDWAAERTDYPSEMAELALAHTVGSEVERAYRRTDLVEKRRAMMTAWARFLRGEAGQKVVALGALR